MRRLVEETACQHGYFGGCTFKTDSGDPCPGGTSKVVEVDYEAAFQKAQENGYRAGIYEIEPEAVRELIDAALGVGS